MCVFTVSNVFGGFRETLIAENPLLIFAKTGRPWASDCHHWTGHLDLAFVLVPSAAEINEKTSDSRIFAKLS